MRFFLGLEIQHKVGYLSEVVHMFSEYIDFRLENYGKGLDSIYVGVILMDISSHYPKRRLKFEPARPVKQDDGTYLTRESYIAFDTKFNPDLYNTKDKIPFFRRDLAEAIAVELPIIRKHRKKYPELEVDRLIDDINAMLKVCAISN